MTTPYLGKVIGHVHFSVQIEQLFVQKFKLLQIRNLNLHLIKAQAHSLQMQF